MDLGSNFDSHSTVTSPDLQKPKKVVVEAAHKMILLKVGWPSNQTLLSLWRIQGVIGRCGRAFPDLAGWTLADTFEDLAEPRHLVNQWVRETSYYLNLTNT